MTETYPGGAGIPGQGDADFTTEREILWGGDNAKGKATWMSGVYTGAMRDAGNSPTTVVRPGLLVGKITATGLLKEWDADGSDGSQDLFGILQEELKAQDFNANNADRTWRVLVRGHVRTSQLLIQGTLFTSHVDEFLARQMLASNFVFDDDPHGYKAGLGNRVRTLAASASITEAQNGTIFFVGTADATLTLPTIHPGLFYDFIRVSDHETVVASAEGDNVIVGNDLSADSVTFTTAGQQIGARVRIKAHYFGTTLKWVVELPSAPFGTGLTGGFAYSIAT